MLMLSIRSIKNTVRITDSISVQGKPHDVKLNEKETALLLRLNIRVDGPVLLYPRLFLCKTRRVVAKDLGKTLRDDSYITYRINSSIRVGTLQKVVVCAGNYFIFINDVPISEEKLCNDQLSYLNIDDHIFKICPSRYIIYEYKQS